MLYAGANRSLLGLGMGRMGSVGGAGSMSLEAQIAAIFAGGAPGLWYDPSTFANLYQGSAGTSPATAVGQPAGLMLDRRLAPIDLPSSGWFVNSGDGVLSVNGNTVTITGATTTTRVDVSSSGWAIGDLGVLSVNASIGSAVGATLWVGGSPTTPSAGAKTYSYVIAGSTLYRLQITSGTASFEILSRKKYPGYHISQPTASARPLIASSGGVQSLTFDGLDDGMSTGAVVLSSNMDCFIALRRDSAARFILAGQTPGPRYFGYVESSIGTTSTPGVGALATHFVNGIAVPGGTATTAAQLNTALPVGAWQVLEIRNLDLSLLGILGIGAVYPSLCLNGAIASLILCPAQSDAMRTTIRQYLAKKAGITL